MRVILSQYKDPYCMTSQMRCYIIEVAWARKTSDQWDYRAGYSGWGAGWLLFGLPAGNLRVVDCQYGSKFLRLSTSSRWWQLKYFLFSPLFGEDFQFDEHIFQMGWFNHQPVMDVEQQFDPRSR